MNVCTLLAATSLAAVSFEAGTLCAQRPEKPPLESRIWKVADARLSTGSWGSISIYTEDSQPSFGTNSVSTAQLEFLPGEQLQPPHQHADEEFQYVIDGSGTWSLDGVEYPLAVGDLMYSKPWDWHGFRNSGDKPMRFFVFTWQARGVTAPPKPAG